MTGAAHHKVRVLGVSYAACIVAALRMFPTAGPTSTSLALGAAAIAALLALFLPRSVEAQTAIRGVAGLHLGIGLFAIKAVLWAKEVEGAEFFAWYLVLNVTVPALAIALLPLIDAPEGQDLPIGYEHVGGERRLSIPERIVLVVAMTLAIPTFMMGGILLTIIWLPVVLGAYWIVKIIRTRRSPAPTAPRRMRLSPKMRKPAQQRNYWTVNASQYDDPDLFEQD